MFVPTLDRRQTLTPLCAVRLEAAIAASEALLAALPDAETTRPRAPGKWSPRQEIGHLIDSASNNHGRFVRAALTDDLVSPGYEQDEWVAIQDYQHAAWHDLVSLWAAFNRNLARVMAAIHERLCRSPRAPSPPGARLNVVLAWSGATMRTRVVLVLIALLSACRAQPAVAPPMVGPQDAFWAALQSICGRAYAGRIVEGNASDSAFRTSALRMHVRTCAPGEIRIPFHLGENRSRTWVVTRTAMGLRLKHDHRHEDGMEDSVTQYGGDTHDSGTAAKQEFHADAHTATLIPAARTNIWTIEILPGSSFAYALRREGTDRRFRVEFDLTKPIAAPPPPWGTQ